MKAVSRRNQKRSPAKRRTKSEQMFVFVGGGGGGDYLMTRNICEHFISIHRLVELYVVYYVFRATLVFSLQARLTIISA